MLENYSRQASEEEIRQRLDLRVMKAYSEDPSKAAQVRAAFLQSWREDEGLSQLVLSRVGGISGVSDKEDERALKNIVDYWFEAMAVQTMNIGQVRDYYTAIEQQMSLDVAEEFPGAGQSPLLIQTMHHCCCFSVLYSVGAILLRDYGYERVILPHLHDPLDSRLEACKQLVTHVLGAEFVPIRMGGDWLKDLARNFTNRTYMFYMSDMPPSLFPGRHRPGKTSSRIRLYVSSKTSIDVEGISMASLLSRWFKAKNLVLDFPGLDEIRIRPWQNGADAELACAFSDWAFWPSMRQLYKEAPAPAK